MAKSRTSSPKNKTQEQPQQPEKRPSPPKTEGSANNWKTIDVSREGGQVITTKVLQVQAFGRNTGVIAMVSTAAGAEIREAVSFVPGVYIVESDGKAGLKQLGY